MIDSKYEIIPPIGSIRSEKNGIITYEELKRYSGYSIYEGKFVRWQGVECEGNPENQKTIYFNEQNLSVCELCKNQMKCIFKNRNSVESFQMKDDFVEIERERFNNWIHQNKKKYKIETKNPRRS